MMAVKEKQDTYLSEFLEREKQLPGSGQSWMERLRREAIERFAELGFPTTKHEEWKHTNIGPIASTRFALAPVPTLASGALGPGGCADLDTTRMIFLNGRYSPRLSMPEMLAPGVKVGSLKAAFGDARSSATLEAHLTRYATFEKHPFVALNTAFMEDGAFIEVEKNVVVEKPIHVLYVTIAKGAPTLASPRNLMLIGHGAQATFIESYITLGGGVYLTNAVTELVAGEGAVVHHYKLQRESEAAYHISYLLFHQERSSSLTTCTVALGSRLAREEVRNVLNGEGAESMLNGLYVVAGEQHVDNHTTIDHAKPHCRSRELYKGVLDGRAHGVFNGRIIVRKDAQKTDSKQSNKNLLLSAEAEIDTKPQLEIYADDVKCTHGATIGQVDGEAVFYLRSRGLDLNDARQLLVRAFAAEVVGRIKHFPLKVHLNEEIGGRLGPR